VDVKFDWNHGGSNAFLCGSFNDWKPLCMNKHNDNTFTLTLPLSPGAHQYKFIIDNIWCYDTQKPLVQYNSNINNFIQVSPRKANNVIYSNPTQLLDYFVIIDFEATCDSVNPPAPQEIIEFPSVLVNARTLEIEGEFEAFVKPVYHPILRPFCTELTTITQEQVDSAEPFNTVYQNHQKWIQGYGLSLVNTNKPCWSFVSCGDWDFISMFPTQLMASHIEEIPYCFTNWINIKKWFCEFTGKPSMGMEGMLRYLKIPLTGTHHRGIDDCRNIAKILIHLCKNNVIISKTSLLPPSRYPPLQLWIRKYDESQYLPFNLVKRSMASLLGNASGIFKTQLTRVFLDTGEELNEESILSLEKNSRLVFTSGHTLK